MLSRVGRGVGIFMANVEQHRSWSPGLQDRDNATLLRIAADSLSWATGDRRHVFDEARYQISEALRAPCATFVTLHVQGRLRGCIGTLAPVSPLHRSVHENAVAAALHDQRFPPLSAVEMPAVKIHISILSPMRPIPGLADFRVGEQGLVLISGRIRSVFLPEVAAEQGWSREETAAALCEKAGLPEDAWRRGTRFEVFETVSLG